MVISFYALIIGFMLDLIIGDPNFLPHPVRFIGKLILISEKIIRRIFPKTKNGEILGGLFLVIIVSAISTAIPFFILLYSGKISIYLRLIIESIMCYQILAVKSLRNESMKVYKELVNGDIEKAKFNVSMIVGRDTENLDDIEITKAAIETVAENTSDGIIAPMIFCAFGGAYFGFLYKTINTMDSMVGYKNDKYIFFGRTAAFVDDMVNYIPARISALLMIISSKIMKLNVKNAYKIWWRDNRNHASPNSAQTESVCAGALEIQLAGNAFYHGKLYEKPFIGDDIRPVEYEDIKRTNKLLYTTAIISMLLIIVIKGTLIICL